MMAGLPTFRTTAFELTFKQTAVDLFGLLNTKRRIVVVKRWGVLLTCLHSLVVLLEVASSLETDCFINFQRRLISRQGTHKTIHRDNGTNFTRAAREIKEAIDGWNKKQIQEGCQWVF